MFHSRKEKVKWAFLLIHKDIFFSLCTNHARIDALFPFFSRFMLTRQPVIRNTHWERIWTGKKMYIDVMVSVNPAGIFVVRSMCDISPPFTSHIYIYICIVQ
jgi:hypothetical protein